MFFCPQRSLFEDLVSYGFQLITIIFLLNYKLIAFFWWPRFRRQIMLLIKRVVNVEVSSHFLSWWMSLDSSFWISLSSFSMVTFSSILSLLLAKILCLDHVLPVGPYKGTWEDEPLIYNTNGIQFENSYRSVMPTHFLLWELSKLLEYWRK